MAVADDNDEFWMSVEESVDEDGATGEVTPAADTTEGWKPGVPTEFRAVVYYAGLAAITASFIIPGNTWVERAGLAIGFLASALGVAYRSK